MKKKLPSIAGTDGSEGMMERGRLPFQHIIHNPLNVQGDDGPAAFVGLKEDAVVGVVVEEILCEGGGTECVLEDEEVAFPVGITVGIIFPELVPGEPERCGPVEAVCQPVASGLAPGGVAGPAAGGHPLMAVAGSVGVDGDQADILPSEFPAAVVDALYAGAEGDVVCFLQGFLQR